MKKLTSILTIIALSLGLTAKASQPHGEENEHGHSIEEEFDAASHAIHHALDAHEFHLADGLVIPLPVLLWTDNGLVTFMSSEFHHDDNGKVIVERNGMKFAKIHETIYQLDASAEHVMLDADHHPTNAHKVWMDFSITKNVSTIFVVAILLILIFFRTRKKYTAGVPAAPTGIAKFTEPLILFVRDTAKDSIEGEKYHKFVPYLLTVFFFILFGNLLGLIPFISNPNMTGSISITLLLALFTFIIQMINTKSGYWKHIFLPPGPVWLYPIMIPIEVAGIFIKPAALMIRLFANITAGHIIVVSLVGIVFVTKNIAWAGLSVPMALFISTLEILVAFLQAYIFMMLSALYFGMAVEEPHH